MPIKENDLLPKLYVVQPDGKKMIIGDIGHAEIISDETEDIYGREESLILPLPSPETVIFKIKLYPSVDFLHLLIYGRIPSNNWRRMHGFRSRRKVKCDEKIKQRRNQ